VRLVGDFGCVEIPFVVHAEMGIAIASIASPELEGRGDGERNVVSSPEVGCLGIRANSSLGRNNLRAWRIEISFPIDEQSRSVRRRNRSRNRSWPRTSHGKARVDGGGCNGTE